MLNSPCLEVLMSDITAKTADVAVGATLKGSSLSLAESLSSISSDSYAMYPAGFDVDTINAFADFSNNRVPFLAKKDHGRKVFLNCSSQIVLTTIVEEAIRDFFVKRASSPDAEFIVFDSVIEKTRGLYAELLGLSPEVDSDTICYTRDSSEALHLLQESFDFSVGDSIVVLDNEFQHNNLSWLGYIKRHPELKLNLKVIDTNYDKNFVLNADSIAPYMDSSVKVVSLSCTMYQSGLKNDIASITAKYNSQGVHTIVDLTQDCGFQKTDVKAMGCSAAFFSSFKGLFVPQGLGILFMSKDLCQNSKQISPFVNIKGLSTFDPNELKVDTEYPLEKHLHKCALKFEHCNKPTLQIYASYFMLSFLLHDLGIENIESYLRFLRENLEAILTTFNIKVYSANAKSSNIVVAEINNPQWMKFFRANDCFVSQFRGITRFSIGIYNTVDDLKALEKLLAKGVAQGIPFNV